MTGPLLTSAPLALVILLLAASALGDRRLLGAGLPVALLALVGSTGALWGAGVVAGAALARPDEAPDPLRRATLGAASGLLAVSLGVAAGAAASPLNGLPWLATATLTTALTLASLTAWLRLDPDGPTGVGAIGLRPDDAEPITAARRLYAEARAHAPWRLRAPLARLTACVRGASLAAHRLRQVLARQRADGARAERVRAALATTLDERQRLLDALEEAHAALLVAAATQGQVDDEVRAHVVALAREAWARRDAAVEVAPLRA